MFLHRMVVQMITNIWVEHAVSILRAERITSKFMLNTEISSALKMATGVVSPYNTILTYLLHGAESFLRS